MKHCQASMICLWNSQQFLSNSVKTDTRLFTLASFLKQDTIMSTLNDLSEWLRFVSLISFVLKGPWMWCSLSQQWSIIETTTDAQAHSAIVQEPMCVAGDWIQPHPGGKRKCWNTAVNFSAACFVSIFKYSNECNLHTSLKYLLWAGFSEWLRTRLSADVRTSSAEDSETRSCWARKATHLTLPEIWLLSSHSFWTW